MTSESLLRSDSIELAQRSRNDAAEIGNGLSSIADSIVHAFLVASLLAIVFLLDSHGAVFSITLAAALIFPLAAYLPIRKTACLNRLASEANELARKRLTESVAGAGSLRRNGAAGLRINELRVLQMEAFKANENYRQFKLTQQTIGMYLGGLIGTVVLVASVKTMPNEPSNIVSLFILSNMVLFATNKLTTNLANIPNLFHSSRRFLDLMSEQKEQHVLSSSTQSLISVHRIKFDHLSASTTQLDSIGLLNFSLEINQGESAMLVDDSGQCIEALSKLLVGHSSPDTGRILLNSINLEDFNAEQRRQTVGYLPREPYVFQTSLRSNIAPQSFNLGIERMDELVKTVGLDEMVDKLPQRLDSIVGRQGIFTTWDERYRIGLARLVQRNPQVIILELPKFALPSSLCQTINHLINGYWQNRIVIVLSSHHATEIHCRSKHRFNRVGQFTPTL